MAAARHENPTDSAPALGLFRNRNFRRLWVGSVTSALGAAVGSVVVVWVVYAETRSPLEISLLGIVQFLPTLLFGLLAGALIDRLDRRRLMVACDLARAVSFGALAVFVWIVGVNVAVLIGVMFAVATFSTVFRPATNAALPRILAPPEVVDGNGLLQAGTTAGQFIGSPLGGVFAVASMVVVGFAVNAVTFAVSAALIFLMVFPRRPGVRSPEPAGRRSLLGDVGDGLRYLRSQPTLLLITLTAMGSNFFLTIWGGFTVIYAGAHLGQGAVGYAILTAANTAGFAVGAVVPGRVNTARAPGPWVVATWGTVGFVIVALTLTSSLVVATALTVGGGVLLSMGNTIWLSTVQRTVPDEFLGRFFATDEAGSYAMIPAGMAVGGVLVAVYGIEWAYLVAGLGALLLNLPLVLSRDFHRWGRPDAAGRPVA